VSFFSFFNKNNRNYSNQLLKIYSDLGYLKMPKLPSEDECKRILLEYKSFPASLVGKNNMNDKCGHLLRGHIILLWWLNNSRTDKNKIPSYFLYEYGIDFSNELSALESQGYICNFSLTDKGIETIDKYEKVILEHKSTKIYSSDGNIKYHRSDKNIVFDNNSSTILDFSSSGSYLEDQRIGRAYERNGDYEKAIQAYYSAWKLAEKESINNHLPPPNIYERLAIIYRKQKDYLNEIKIMSKAVEDYPNDRFKERLKKAKDLYKKNSIFDKDHK